MIKLAVKIGFGLFVLVLQSINMWLTAQFGFNYIQAAFGSSAAAAMLGALYTVLIADIASIVWFFVFMKASESVPQRVVSLLLAIAALMFSILATVVQLSTNAKELVDLSSSQNTIGMTAFVFMLLLTAAHIIGMAVYTLTDPAEFTRQWSMNLRATVTSDALRAARDRMMNEDKKRIVDQLVESIRAEVLEELGFDRSLAYTGYDNKQPLPLPAPLPMSQPEPITESEPTILEMEPTPSLEEQARLQEEYAKRNLEYARRNEENARQLRAEAEQQANPDPKAVTLEPNGNHKE